MYTVRKFDQVDGDQASFELSTLLAIKWAGDHHMGQFKSKWDHIVRHLRTPLSDRDLESILINKVRVSEVLLPHLQYYDRLPRLHKDKTYRWISETIDQLVLNARQARNSESLVLDASGLDQEPTTRRFSARALRAKVQDPRSKARR